MSRPLRIEFPGAFYHVLDRGVDRRKIFREERDFRSFLNLLKTVGSHHRIDLFCYCLMPNHYHLFLSTANGCLHRFMQDLNGRYAQYYNGRCGRVGPVFEGRYKSILVDKDNYALSVSKYIHMNAVAAGLARRPEEYPWSSFRAYLGREDLGGLLNTDWLLGQFAKDLKRSRDLLRQFTLGRDGDEEAMKASQAKLAVLGNESFLRWVRREKVPAGKKEGIRGLRQIQKPSGMVKEALEKRIHGLTGNAKLRRKMLIYGLHCGTTLTGREIAECVGAGSRSAAAQTVSRLKKQRYRDKPLSLLLRKIESMCRR